MYLSQKSLEKVADRVKKSLEKVYGFAYHRESIVYLNFYENPAYIHFAGS